MNEEIINVFITSKNRENTDKAYSFKVNFPDGLIKALPSQYITVNVISFDMMNTMYNINSNNNSFKIHNQNFNLTINIPEGNYSVHSLLVWLKIALNGYASVDYNIAQNTFTFTGLINDGLTWYLTSITAGQFLGLVDNLDYELTFNSPFSGRYINLVDYDKIILRTLNLNYKKETLDNITSTELKISNILFWISRQDIEPFKMIKYDNVDGGNSFCYKIHNSGVDFIQFLIEDEHGRPIENCPDFTLGLQFSIIENPDKTNIDLLKKLNYLINEIYYILLEFLGFFLSPKRM